MSPINDCFEYYASSEHKKKTKMQRGGGRTGENRLAVEIGNLSPESVMRENRTAIAGLMGFVRVGTQVETRHGHPVECVSKIVLIATGHMLV